MSPFSRVGRPHGPSHQRRGQFSRLSEPPAPSATAYAPFDPSSGGAVLSNMRLGLPMDRLDDRRRLLQQLDRVQWQMSEERSLEASIRRSRQAFDIIVRGLGDAFDLRAKTRDSSPATIPPRSSIPNASTGAGTITTTTWTTPVRSASCCFWPAGYASAVAASSRSPRTSSGTCMPTSTTPP